MKIRKYSVLASVVLVTIVLAYLLLSVPAMAVSVVPVHSVNGLLPDETRGLAYTSTDILLLTSKSVVPMYSASRLFEMIALAYTSMEIPLLTDNTLATGIMSSIIFVVLITNVTEIDKIMRRLIRGHYKGPPIEYIVSLASWVRVSVIAAIAELINIRLYGTVDIYNENKMPADFRTKLALSEELRTISDDHNIHAFGTLKA